MPERGSNSCSRETISLEGVTREQQQVIQGVAGNSVTKAGGSRRAAPTPGPGSHGQQSQVWSRGPVSILRSLCCLSVCTFSGHTGAPPAMRQGPVRLHKNREEPRAAPGSAPL